MLFLLLLMKTAKQYEQQRFRIDTARGLVNVAMDRIEFQNVKSAPH